MEGKVVRHGTLCIGTAITVATIDLSPDRLDIIGGSTAALDRPNFPVLLKAALTQLATGIQTSRVDRAVCFVKSRMMTAAIYRNDVFNILSLITHRPLGILHLLQSIGAVCRNIVGAVLTCIIIQTQLTVGVQAPCINFGSIGPMNFALNQNTVFSAQSHILNIRHRLIGPVGTSTVGGCHRVTIHTYIGKTRIHGSKQRISAAVNVAGDHHLVIRGLEEGRGVTRRHIQNSVQVTIIVDMAHIGIIRLIGDTSTDMVGIKVGVLGIGTPGHHCTIFPQCHRVGIAGRDGNDVTQSPLGGIPGTALAHAGSGSSRRHLDRGSGVRRAVIVAQLSAGINAPSPNGSVLGQCQSVLRPSGHSQHIVHIFGRGPRYDRVLLPIFPGDHGIGHRRLKENLVRIEPLGSSGVNAQLAHIVVAPSPDDTVHIHRQGKVRASSDIHNVGQRHIVAALQPHHLSGRGVGIRITAAQLTHVVLPPGPHCTIRLQTDSKVIACGDFGRSHLTVLILNDGDMDHAIFMDIVGFLIAHHSDENVCLTIAIVHIVYLVRNHSDCAAVHSDTCHILIRGPGQELIVLQPIGIIDCNSVFIKELKSGDILQRGLSHVHAQSLILLDGNIALFLLIQNDLRAADSHRLIQIEGVEILSTHPIGIVPIGRIIIDEGIGAILKGNTIGTAQIAAQLTFTVAAHTIETAVNALNDGMSITHRCRQDVIHGLCGNISIVVGYIGTLRIIGSLQNGHRIIDHSIGCSIIADAHLVGAILIGVSAKGIGPTIRCSNGIMTVVSAEADRFHRSAPVSVPMHRHGEVVAGLAIVLVAPYGHIIHPVNDKTTSASHVQIGGAPDVGIICQSSCFALPDIAGGIHDLGAGSTHAGLTATVVAPNYHTAVLPQSGVRIMAHSNFDYIIQYPGFAGTTHSIKHISESSISLTVLRNRVMPILLNMRSIVGINYRTILQQSQPAIRSCRHSYSFLVIRHTIWPRKVIIGLMPNIVIITVIPIPVIAQKPDFSIGS